MITELVFENALTDLHPTEIAALLSSMVFEQKNASEPKLIDTLEKVNGLAGVDWLYGLDVCIYCCKFVCA